MLNKICFVILVLWVVYEIEKVRDRHKNEASRRDVSAFMSGYSYYDDDDDEEDDKYDNYRSSRSSTYSSRHDKRESKAATRRERDAARKREEDEWEDMMMYVEVFSEDLDD